MDNKIDHMIALFDKMTDSEQTWILGHFALLLKERENQ